METQVKTRVSWWLAAVLAALFALSLFFLMYGNYLSGQRSWNLVISALLLSVPLALLYVTTGVLITANQQRRESGQISSRLAKWIYWTPRIAGILIIVFVGLFALDVFYPGGNFWEMLLGFLLHAMPSIVMAVVLAFAWRRPVIGFAAFLFAAVFFLRFTFGNALPQAVGILLLFSGPMAVIAAAFWANWKWQEQLRPEQKAR